MSLNESGADPVPRGRPRDTRVDEAILDAALALFADGGQDAVTFDGVATRAGVSRSAVYRRWNNREQMVGAALTRHRERGERGAEDWQLAPSVGAVMSLFADRAVQTLTDPQSLRLLTHVQALDHRSPVKRAYWTSIVEPRRRAFSAMILAARGSGELAPGPDADVIQDLLAGALSYRALSHPEPLTEPEARNYVRSVLDAIGMPAAPSS